MAVWLFRRVLWRCVKRIRVNCLLTWIHLMTKVLHTDARSQSLTHKVVLGQHCVWHEGISVTVSEVIPTVLSDSRDPRAAPLLPRIQRSTLHLNTSLHVKRASVYKFVWKHVTLCMICRAFLFQHADSSYCNAELTWTIFYPVHSNWTFAAPATRLAPFFLVCLFALSLKTSHFSCRHWWPWSGSPATVGLLYKQRAHTESWDLKARPLGKQRYVTMTR